MPTFNTQDIRQSQTQILEILEILPRGTVEQHTLHVMLQLILAIEAVEARDHGIPRCQIVYDAIEGENSRIKHVYRGSY